MIPKCKKTDKEIESLNKSNTYSTEEQRIGIWIDGKPLYRKVVVGKTFSEQLYTTILPADNIGGYVNVNGFARSNDNLLSKVPIYWSETLKFVIQINTNVSTMDLILTYGESFKNSNYYLIIEYTKTTD